MAKVKFKDIQKMNESERTKRLEELKLELIKSKVSAVKKGSARTKEIKKVIARIHTSNKQNGSKK